MSVFALASAVEVRAGLWMAERLALTILDPGYPLRSDRSLIFKSAIIRLAATQVGQGVGSLPKERAYCQISRKHRCQITR
jgi:hypothetical protein